VHAPAVATPSGVGAAGAGTAPVPGTVAVASARLTPTLVSSRHWFEIATESPPPRRALTIARTELEARLGPQAGAPVCVAVPASFDAGALAQVLGLMRSASLDVVAFVDAGVATAAALELRRGAIIVDVGLHHVAATRVDAEGEELRRRSALVRTRGGLEGLQESALQLISEAMVRRTRFDPLHDAANEQKLYDALPDILERAAAEGSARVALDAGAERYEVDLARDQFAEAAANLYRDIVGMIHELRPAGAPLSIVLPQPAVGLPGLLTALGEFHDCDVLVAPPGCAAIAASRIAVDAAGSGTVRLLRGVRRFAEPVLDAADLAFARRIERPEGLVTQAPTHVLWSGRAIELARRSVEIGRAPPAGGIALPDGLAGVSRLHCTLRDDGEGIVVVDHSRHGTLVNGERVAGRARLRAGDVLRVGEPGVELPLIAVGAAGA
jgi:hypothetical protein